MASNGELPERECDGCGKSFQPSSSRQRFHSAACRKKSKRKAKQEAEPTPQEKVVQWATTHGAPTRLLVGWNPQTGTWEDESPVGQVLADVARGSHLVVTARRYGFADINSLMLSGAEYANQSEDRELLPIEVLPMVDLFHQINYEEAGAEIELSNSVYEKAKKDGKLGLDFLSRRYPSRWREQQSISTVDEDDMREKAVSSLISDPATAMALAGMAAQVEDAIEDEERADA